MKKYCWLYILCFLCFQVSFSRETGQDSLHIDNSQLEKRDFPTGFKERYSGSEYIYESDSSHGWFSRFKEWLILFLMDFFGFGSRQKAMNIADIFLQVFYILVVLTVVFFIVRAIMNREGQWAFRKSSDRKLITTNDLENNIHIVDFNQLVRESASQKQYREAIRYYYLWLLKELSGKGLIDYDVEKTNSDYLRELKSDTIRSGFGYVSYLYDYIWYGEFTIDQAQYTNAARTFSDLINSIEDEQQH